jgi:branched-subunit amino acid transport protein AzlD
VTKSQSAAYKMLSIVFLAVGMFLLRFAYLAIFKDINLGSDLWGGIYTKAAAMPAGILGLIAVVAACVLLIKALGRVVE